MKHGFCPKGSWLYIENRVSKTEECDYTRWNDCVVRKWYSFGLSSYNGRWELKKRGFFTAKHDNHCPLFSFLRQPWVMRPQRLVSWLLNQLKSLNLISYVFPILLVNFPVSPPLNIVALNFDMYSFRS